MRLLHIYLCILWFILTVNPPKVMVPIESGHPVMAIKTIYVNLQNLWTNGVSLPVGKSCAIVLYVSSSKCVGFRGI